MKTRLAVLALCLGCGRQSGSRADLVDHAPAVAAQLRLADAMTTATAAQSVAMASPPPSPAAKSDDDAPLDVNAVDSRKLIRNATMRLQVDSVARAIARVDSAAKTHEGAITDTHESRDPNGRGDGHIVLRVPIARFDALLADLRRIGKVQDEETSTDDITKQYTDLETRIAVKEETVGRLRVLLATRTGKLSDVVDLERELSRTVTELEQLKGERRYYDQQVAMSTVTLDLVEPNVIVASGVSTSASDALRHSLELLHASALAVIYTLTFLAPWLPLLVGAWWLQGKLRSRRAPVAGT